MSHKDPEKHRAYQKAYQAQYYLRNRERLSAQKKAKYVPRPKGPTKATREFLYLRYYHDGKQLQHGLVVHPRAGDIKFKRVGVVT